LNEVYDFFPLLKERRKEKSNCLSGGILRMLSIGKEIMTKPRFLLIDEPSEGLAPKIVKEIYNFLIKSKEQGTTIFLVDQNILKALEVSDHMYLLEMGQIKQEGPKEAFEENIREAILGFSILYTAPGNRLVLSSQLGIFFDTIARSMESAITPDATMFSILLRTKVLLVSPSAAI
jgi:ABC-type multidrug transport system ATPase subunit